MGFGIGKVGSGGGVTALWQRVHKRSGDLWLGVGAASSIPAHAAAVRAAQA